ncbi:MAG TPA: hypothetical protein VD704_09690 [Gaiellaceae bacterium]|nr:hypothetical protein [Gaiellaceae bacterium]
MALAAIAVVAAAAAFRGGSEAETVPWSPLPESPLSAREPGAGIWTGEEVLILGGSDAPPCHPSAGCVPPTEPPLADGAAYDPAARTWRSLAEAPVAFEWAQPLLAGTTVYLWIQGSSARPDAPRAFLAYDLEEDRWEELPVPTESERSGLTLLSAGNRVVAYELESAAGPDFVFDPAAGRWSELPPAPPTPGFDRVMAWDGDEVVLVDHELTPNPGSEEEPIVTRAAAFDLERGSWRVLDDLEQAIAAIEGGEDGLLRDPRLRGWRTGPDDFTVAGFVDGERSHYYGNPGLVLDVEREVWLRMPALRGETFGGGDATVAAGRSFVVWGGAGWPPGDEDGELLADGWIWTPPG